MNLKCIVEKGGILPLKATTGSMGWDVFATTLEIVDQGETRAIPLNVRLDLLDSGYWAQVVGKSGLGRKGLIVHSGIIDIDYTGIIHVVCTNLTGEILRFERGHKIAQIILHKTPECGIIEASNQLKLAETTRGAGGFGSTGA